ncbi:MAG: 2-oxo acid dehydrogenase subunit E2 [Candidatus Heimdallarchaeaceae archaeon]|jgi:pyruvate/2-oxoglutarate dehydrogenase complex dihydrolipoamide acyltransferase (E2) component
MSKIGNYEVKKFPKSRKMVFDLVEQSAKKHHVKAVFEVDVTTAREFFRKHKEETGEKLSFTGWVIRCIGGAAKEYPEINSIRKGRRKYYVFEDIDIGIVVERIIGGKRVPTKYFMKKVNKKTYREIHDEIRKVQSQKLEGPVLGEVKEDKTAHLVVKLPKFIRNIIWWQVNRKPLMRKKHLGAITVSAIGMFAEQGGWGISMSSETTHFMIGGIGKKPGVVNDKIEIREYLSLTVMIDHFIVDGGPFARFVQQLINLLQSGFGLDEV